MGGKQQKSPHVGSLSDHIHDVSIVGLGTTSPLNRKLELFHWMSGHSLVKNDIQPCVHLIPTLPMYLDEST